MKILNQSGIRKIIKYLGEDRFALAKPYGLDCLLGKVTQEDKEKLSEIGVTLHPCSNDGVLFEATLSEEASLDSTKVEPEDPTSSEEPKQVGDGIPEGEVRKLANALIPYLERNFPTKEELNDILSALQAQAIDPEEMIDGLKMQIKRIKKQSRVNDEVG